jgi:methionyl-tRNA synthetase
MVSQRLGGSTFSLVFTLWLTALMGYLAGFKELDKQGWKKIMKRNNWTALIMKDNRI